MDSVTAAEIAKLETMTVSKLVEKFESLVGEKCRSRNKRYLMRRIAWRLQANAEGEGSRQQHDKLRLRRTESSGAQHQRALEVKKLCV
jgi:hypothetical protein